MIDEKAMDKLAVMLIGLAITSILLYGFTGWYIIKGIKYLLT